MNDIYIISSIYKVAGMLEGLSNMQGQTITEAMAYQLTDCAEVLNIIGQDMLARKVGGDGKEETYPAQ